MIWLQKERGKKLNKKILALIVAVIIIVSVVATAELIQPAAKPSADARNINIALVAPVSKSPVGTDMQRAAELAVNEINQNGGVYVSGWHTHVNITLSTVDTIDDSPANAKTAMTTFQSTNSVDMYIGGYGSAGTLADETVATSNKIPFIITGASNQLVTRRGPQGDFGGLAPGDTTRIADADQMSYVFHYCTTTYQYTKTIMDFFATQMKPMVAPNRNISIAVLYRNDAFGQGVDQAAQFWVKNESLPINLVIQRSYDPTETNYQADLIAVQSAHPDAVIVVDNPDKTPLIIQQGWNDVGLKTVYIAIENNQDPAFYSMIGDTGNGQLMESKMDPFMTPSYSTAVQSYTQKFYAKYGVYPGMMGADTYDAFYIAKAAIESAGTVDKPSVRTALETVSINDMNILTSNGKIQFSSGVNWHEIAANTFIEQLVWNSTSSKLESHIVWAPTAINGVTPATFTLPQGYKAGS